MSGSETWLSYPDAPRVRTPLPGPRSRELLAEQARLETDAVVYAKYFPIAIANAQGSTVEDVDGNRFIDWVAGVSVLNLGHRHPALAAALADQAGKVWHALELPTEARSRSSRRSSTCSPGKLRGHARVLFTVTGGDAVETAVNLADYAKGRHGTVTFSGAYHGVHGGAANLTSGRRYHRTTSFHGGHVVRVPFPDPYRPLLGSAGDLTNATIRYLEHLVERPALRRRRALERPRRTDPRGRGVRRAPGRLPPGASGSSATPTTCSSSPTRSRPASAGRRDVGGRPCEGHPRHPLRGEDDRRRASRFDGRVPRRPRPLPASRVSPRHLPGEPARPRGRDRRPRGADVAPMWSRGRSGGGVGCSSGSATVQADGPRDRGRPGPRVHGRDRVRPLRDRQGTLDRPGEGDAARAVRAGRPDAHVRRVRPRPAVHGPAHHRRRAARARARRCSPRRRSSALGDRRGPPGWRLRSLGPRPSPPPSIPLPPSPPISPGSRRPRGARSRERVPTPAEDLRADGPATRATRTPGSISRPSGSRSSGSSSRFFPTGRTASTSSRGTETMPRGRSSSRSSAGSARPAGRSTSALVPTPIWDVFGALAVYRRIFAAEGRSDRNASAVVPIRVNVSTGTKITGDRGDPRLHAVAGRAVPRPGLPRLVQWPDPEGPAGQRRGPLGRPRRRLRAASPDRGARRGPRGARPAAGARSGSGTSSGRSGSTAPSTTGPRRPHRPSTAGSGSVSGPSRRSGDSSRRRQRVDGAGSG